MLMTAFFVWGQVMIDIPVFGVCPSHLCSDTSLYADTEERGRVEVK